MVSEFVARWKQASKCLMKHIFIEMKTFNLSSFARSFHFFPLIQLITEQRLCYDSLVIQQNSHSHSHDALSHIRSLFNYAMKSFAVVTCFPSKFVVFHICLRPNDVMNAWPVVDFSTQFELSIGAAWKTFACAFRLQPKNKQKHHTHSGAHTAQCTHIRIERYLKFN